MYNLFYLLLCYFIIIYCIIIKSVSPLMPHFLFPCPKPLLFLLPEGFLRWLYHLRVFSLISLQYCHIAHVLSLNKLPYLLIWSPILLNNCCALPYFIHRPFFICGVLFKKNSHFIIVHSSVKTCSFHYNRNVDDVFTVANQVFHCIVNIINSLYIYKKNCASSSLLHQGYIIIPLALGWL